MSYSIRKILLAVADASAKPAIARAALIARRVNARIELYSVVKPANPLITTRAKARDVSGTRLEHRLRELETVANRLRADGIRVSCEADLEHSPAESILRRIKVSRPDLVIIQAHKHNLLARLMLSQTDFDLIRRCPVPLLIVKTAPLEGRRPALLAALDPWHVGGKPAALNVHLVEVAQTLAMGLGGKLHAAHVHAPPMQYEADSVLAPVLVPVSPAERKRYVAAVRRRFRALGKRLQIASQNLHLRLGDPSLELPELVRSLKIDTLVMGAVSRSVVNRILLGSTAERVLDALPCNALIVKPKGFRAR